MKCRFTGSCTDNRGPAYVTWSPLPAPRHGCLSHNVQYQNQRVVVGAIRMYSCHFITCRFMELSLQPQYRLFHHQGHLLCYPFVATYTPLCTPQLPHIWWPLICSHLYYFVISKMLHKWNCTVCDSVTFQDWLFSLSTVPLRSKLLQIVSIVYSFHCQVGFLGMDILQLTIHLLQDILVDSSFGLLQVQLLYVMSTGFYVNVFSHRCDKCPGVQILSHGKYTVNF